MEEKLERDAVYYMAALKLEEIGLWRASLPPFGYARVREALTSQETWDHLWNLSDYYQPPATTTTTTNTTPLSSNADAPQPTSEASASSTSEDATAAQDPTTTSTADLSSDVSSQSNPEAAAAVSSPSSDPLQQEVRSGQLDLLMTRRQSKIFTILFFSFP